MKTLSLLFDLTIVCVELCHLLDFSLSLSTISDQTRSITPLQTFGLTRMSHRACTACHLLMPGTRSPGSHQAWCHLLLRQAAKRAVRPERATRGRSALTSSSTMPTSPCSSTISTYSSFIITNSNSFYSTNNRSVATSRLRISDIPSIFCTCFSAFASIYYILYI